MWSRVYGNNHFEQNKYCTGFSDNIGTSVQETVGGGYIIVGCNKSYSHGIEPRNVWLIKVDSNRTKVWDITFGGLGEDLGLSVQETNNGDYIIAGSTKSYGSGCQDVWLIKVGCNDEIEVEETANHQEYCVNNMPLLSGNHEEVTYHKVTYVSDPDTDQDMFVPSGWEGDINDIWLDTSSENNPHSGSTCIEIDYSAARLPGYG